MILISGSLPQNNNEIVVEENLLKALDLKIGDLLSLPSYNLEPTSTNDDDDNLYQFKISGVVRSNRYINSDSFIFDRGKTNIGNGTINFYSYVLADSFKEYDADGNIWTLKDKKSLNTVTNGYTNIYIF